MKGVGVMKLVLQWGVDEGAKPWTRGQYGGTVLEHLLVIASLASFDSLFRQILRSRWCALEEASEDASDECWEGIGMSGPSGA